MPGRLQPPHEFLGGRVDGVVVVGLRREVGAGSTQRTDCTERGPLHAGAPAALELAGLQDHLQHLRDLVAGLPGLTKRGRRAVDQGRRRIAADKAAADLRGDMPRRAWMPGQHVEQLHAVGLALRGLKIAGKNPLDALIVDGRVVGKPAQRYAIDRAIRPVRTRDCPASQCASCFIDIVIHVFEALLLAIRSSPVAEKNQVFSTVRILHDAAVVLGTHGVQLEKFARVVLVRMRCLARIQIEHVHHRG